MTTHGPDNPNITPLGNAYGNAHEGMSKDSSTAAFPGTARGAGVHDTVGAYALGVLDDAEMTAFEEHLADCERCAANLDELVGMGPLLAALADLPEPADGPNATTAAPEAALGAQERTAQLPATAPRDHAADLTARPGPQLAHRLLADVTAHRKRQSRRARFLVAAAVALIIAGPLAVLALNGGTGTTQPSAAPGYQVTLRRMDEKVHATDPVTNVSALIGMNQKPWGTDMILELKNVKGPLKCSLIAVGTDGDREQMASWSIPALGYGIAGSPSKSARYPLYVWSATYMERSEIDHFEVRTEDGKHLVTVDARAGV